MGVTVEHTSRVSDVQHAFCHRLGRSLETVSLVLPEGITLLEAARNAQATGVLKESRIDPSRDNASQVVAFDEIVTRHVSDAAFCGHPYDYILTRSVQYWESLTVHFDGYTLQ